MKLIVTNVSAKLVSLTRISKKESLLVINSIQHQYQNILLIDDRIFAKILLILACNPVPIYVHIYIYIIYHRRCSTFSSSFPLPPCLVLDPLLHPRILLSVVKDPVPVGRPCATSKSRPSSRGRRLLNDANHLPRWRGTRAAATRQLQPKRRRAGDGTGFPYFRGVESVWASGIQIYPRTRRAPRFSNLPSTTPRVDCVENWIDSIKIEFENENSKYCILDDLMNLI